MSTFLVDALALPPASRVSHRVPKKRLVEHGAPTASDRKLIESSIEELHWVAALKPSTTGILPFKDETHDYGEIIVFAATLRNDARISRIVELIHRAVPYVLVLCIRYRGTSRLALAHKRASQASAGAIVVEDIRCTAAIDDTFHPGVAKEFICSLAFSEQPSGSLFELYQGWLDRVVALEVAALTGAFNLTRTKDRYTARRRALAEYCRIEREIGLLRAQAGRESQIARRVDLNLAINRLVAELAIADRSLENA